VQAWVPGLISNYSRVTKAIMAYKVHSAHARFLTKRPQMEAVIATHINPFPKALSIHEKRKVPFIPRLPAISLSTLDSDIWLTECNSLAIPSIQICDTQSQFKNITYPIIANQRSITFSYLIVYLAAEVCNTGLIDSHLEFLSFYKYQGSKLLSPSLRRTKIIPSSYIVRDLSYDILSDFSQEFITVDKRLLKWNNKLLLKDVNNLAHDYLFSIRRKKARFMQRLQYQPVHRPKKPLILNKQTYIFNKRNFTYQIKDIMVLSTNLHYGTTKQYYKLIHHYLWISFLYIKRIYNRLSFLITRARKRKFYRKYGKLFFIIRILYHHMIVYNLTLKTALLRKKREKKRFITMISFNKQDIKSLTICSFLLTPGTKVELLKNIENKLKLKKFV
jgi:hypothetical protein